jgi:DNA-binding LacI/PurR family transcriptional regulator
MRPDTPSSWVNGMKIPDDIALAGFSNTYMTSLLDPPLTTVEQPLHETSWNDE